MALCQRCLSAAAVLFCQAHNARLCRQCDYDLHPDGSQEVAHTRVQICQSCQTNGAAIFCIQCRRDNWPAVLCVQCDARIHGNAEDSSAMLHDRVSLEDAVGHFRAHGALPIAAAGLRRILNPLLQQHLFATCSNQMFQTTYNAPFVHGVPVAPQGPSRSPSPGAGWSPAFEGRDVPASPYQKCSNLSPAPGAQHINGGAQYGNVGAQHAGDVPSTSADNGIRNIAPSLHPLPPSPPKSSSEDTNDSGDGGTHHMLEFLGNNEEKQYEDDLVRLFLGACNTAEGTAAGYTDAYSGGETHYPEHSSNFAPAAEALPAPHPVEGAGTMPTGVGYDQVELSAKDGAALFATEFLTHESERAASQGGVGLPPATSAQAPVRAQPPQFLFAPAAPTPELQPVAAGYRWAGGETHLPDSVAGTAVPTAFVAMPHVPLPSAQIVRFPNNQVHVYTPSQPHVAAVEVRTFQAPLLAAVTAAGAAGPPLLNQSQETRLARLMRYKDKRKSRRFNATVRYVGRKLYADTRPRVKGRFISREAAAAAATAGSPSDTPSGDGGAAGNLDGSPHASPSASSPEE